MIDHQVEKGTDKDDQLFQDWFSKSKLLKETDKCYVALGHCRKASVGGVSAEKAQPVIINDSEGNMQFCLLHNGTIYNYKEMAKKYIPDIDIKNMSDSQVMAQIFFHAGYDVLKEYEGAGAFIIQDYRTNQTLVFKGESKGTLYAKTIEEERPLYFVETGKSVIISSIFSILQGLYWGFTVYSVPTNVLAECDGKHFYEVRKYDRSECFHCKRNTTVYNTNNNMDLWDIPVHNSYMSPMVDFDTTTGTYINMATGEDLHGVCYITDFGYISNYATGFNKPYYFWEGIMLCGENAYNALRDMQADKNNLASTLSYISRRLSCNPIVINKKYYTFTADNKRVAFGENYIFPLTNVEIICNKRGKLIASYEGGTTEKFIPIELPKERVAKIIKDVKSSNI